MIKSWRDIALQEQAHLIHAGELMSLHGIQSVIIIDHNDKLKGIISDGDLRKALVMGKSLSVPVQEVMNSNPLVIESSIPDTEISDLFRRTRFKIIPVVKQGRVVSCKFDHEFAFQQYNSAPMLIVAGGFGKRLGDLTKNTPKPLLKVQGKAIIRRGIERAITFGIKQFFISVHYRADQIEKELGDGSSMGASITYLHEDSPLGTAGSLQLLPEITGPFFVSNADIICDINYTQFLDHHRSNNAAATMLVYEQEIQHKYGVVTCDGIYITGFEEKPIWKTRVNAGIYIFENNVKDFIKLNEKIDIPALFLRMKKKREKIIIYPFDGRWSDVGSIEDYEAVKMQTNHN